MIFGVRRHDAAFWVLGAGFWVLGAGFWVLGAGFWVLGAGFWVLGAGFWVLGAGFWVLVRCRCPSTLKAASCPEPYTHLGGLNIADRSVSPLQGSIEGGTIYQGLRPGLSCVAASRLGIPSPEGAKQNRPGREPWVHVKRHGEPCKGDTALPFVSIATTSV